MTYGFRINLNRKTLFGNFYRIPQNRTRAISTSVIKKFSSKMKINSGKASIILQLCSSSQITSPCSPTQRTCI
ncbi:hypothetical protein KQP74_12525 [Bacteroides thetaiotaomicron]|uniref:Uncharacterized protein n=1 Tax=Bacteroides thetaiotaomicron TaxID=818 RepID=A0AB38U7C1_BACT4|nr:hypothetical protein KQP74_12525 [Bacteroides thetaiotaomicron]